MTSKDGTPIAYKQIGNGKPVILVDGALCSSIMGPMPKLAPLLAKDFTVFYYDRGAVMRAVIQSLTQWIVRLKI